MKCSLEDFFYSSFSFSLSKSLCRLCLPNIDNLKFALKSSCRVKLSGYMLIRCHCSYLILTTEELQHSLSCECEENLARLATPDGTVSQENEIKVWTFIETRLSLIMRQHKTTCEVTFLNFYSHNLRQKRSAWVPLPFSLFNVVLQVRKKY